MSVINLGWYWSENKEEHQLAKIDAKDRNTHFYVIGATGTGKTKFLEYLIQQDINSLNGFGVIDPHGDLIEDVKCFLAEEINDSEYADILLKRVVLIDPTDSEYTAIFNPLEKTPNISVSEQANELVSSFRKIWSEAWGVRMEDLMRNSLIALGETGLCLIDLPTFLTNRSFRKSILDKVSHSIALQYFRRFDSMTDRSQLTWIEPVMNKFNAFFSDERIRYMFSMPKSTFNLREIMDQGKVLLIKLDKGRLKDSANLLGSLFMAKIQMAAFSRSNIPKDERVPFYLYIDEFQNFANDSFSVILSEARKYGLSLIMAHQSLAQLPTALKSIVLGNTGVQVYFRLNRQDSQMLAKEAFEYSGFEVKLISNQNPRYWSLGEEWELHTEEFQKLPPRFCYVKHKIEGGIILIQTADIYAESNDDEMRFGLDYLIKRSEVDDYFNQKHILYEKKVGTDKSEEKPTGQETEKPKVEKSKPEPQKSKDPSTEEIYFLKYTSASDCFITEIYKELQLSGYKGDKIKNSLIAKGYLTQKETRKGKKGRLAKTLELTDLGQTFLNKFENQGKGGDHHKHLQMMIKDLAQKLGWIAKIEERIPRTLETIDVGLKKDDIRVAIEISSTSKVIYEIQNIRKCLEAGFDYVLSVCDDEDVLNQIKKEARKSFTHKEKDRIRYYHPDQIKNFLINLSNVSEKCIVSDFITNKKQLIGAEEAAEYLGIKKSTLYDWVLQRKIPHTKIGRLLKFRVEDLDRWIEKRTKEEEILI